MNKNKYNMFKFSLSLFNNKPTEYSACSVFLQARKYGEEIPDNVLEMITPCIERIYKEKHQKLLERVGNNAEKYNDKKKLLLFALKEETIEMACQSYLKETKENVEIDSLRKRLERFLREEIETYIKNNFRESSEFLKYFPFTGSDTAKMLEIYREISRMEYVE